MRQLIPAALIVLTAACASDSESQASAPAAGDQGADESSSMTETPDSLYGLKVHTLEGQPADLSQYEGKVTLVVNVASQCGYTPQYAGLQALHAELAERGFEVLGFPSNEFGGQEPGSPEQIRQFCESRYDVTFPMFAKCEVKPGAGQSPVYAFLEAQTGETPGWNFCKYLVGKDGRVIRFYESGVAPDAAELREAINKALG
jgi:glutathione peroxidase